MANKISTQNKNQQISVKPHGAKIKPGKLAWR
jgi:hypothetical protein